MRIVDRMNRTKARMAEFQPAPVNTGESELSCQPNEGFKKATPTAASICKSDSQTREPLGISYQNEPEPTICPNCGKAIPWEMDSNFCYWQQECQYCRYTAIMQEKANRIPEIMQACGVPPRYHRASIDNFPPAFGQFDLSRGVYVHGSPGTGKTQLLAAIFRQDCLNMQPEMKYPNLPVKPKHREWNDFKYPEYYLPFTTFNHDFPIFVSAPELLLSIKSTFSQRDAETEGNILSRYSRVPVLFLDDLGAEYSSEWAIGVMFILIDRRYNENLRTHISSNLDLDQLAGRLNDRISSRISEMCQPVKLTGSDRRLKAVWSAL